MKSKRRRRARYQDNGIAPGKQLDGPLKDGVVDDLEVIVIALVDEVAGNGAKDPLVWREAPAALRVQPDDPGDRLDALSLVDVDALVNVD